MNVTLIPAPRCPAILAHRAGFPLWRALTCSTAIGILGMGLQPVGNRPMPPPQVVGLCLVEDRSQHHGTDLLQLSHPLLNALIRRFSFGCDEHNPVYPGSQFESVSDDHYR